MCGINGLIYKSGADLENRLQKMNIGILHRGPDKQSFWINENNTIGLSHVRLSILDLSESGNQPMISHSGRFVFVFNGEIYNYQSLRKDLEKEKRFNWRGTSDTEILLEAIEHWGVQTALQKCNGMFAFGLLDKTQNKLVLAKDRMGEKPIYYGWVKGNFVFSSELAAISTLPEFDNPISNDNLGLYLQYSSVPEPYSIYENIYKLNSGSLLNFDINTNRLDIETYWDIKDEIQPREYSSANEAVEQLEQLLKDSIGLQMQADVPTGAFLSGGIDSSTVAAIMQSLSSQKINTFSIGFFDKAYNEAEYAKSVAKHIGSEHHELFIGEKELLDVVPLLSGIYSEPFSESSQIPTYLVSKLAKQSVTVALSGDAGDELFCGYWRYHFVNNLQNKMFKVPNALRQSSSSVLSAIPLNVWKLLLSPLAKRKGAYGDSLNYPDKLLKFLPLLKMKTPKELYHRGFMTNNKATNLINGFNEPATVFTQDTNKFDTFYDKMMYYDLKTYLPNNNLTKVDRAAMAVSLETRVPLLDHRIVSYAMSLPLEYKFRDNQDKWVLKQVLYKYAPKELFDRPKKGFSVPLGSWLKGSLKDWAADLLDEKKIKEDGFFKSELVKKYWDEHQSGKRNWQNTLWSIMIFQDWLRKQR